MQCVKAETYYQATSFLFVQFSLVKKKLRLKKRLRRDALFGKMTHRLDLEKAFKKFYKNLYLVQLGVVFGKIA